MAFEIQRDTNDSPYIEWRQAIDAKGLPHIKRAWIQNRAGKDTDWAGVGRYLLVARVEGRAPLRGPDFPVATDLSDEEALIAFVTKLHEVTGWEPS